MGWVRILIDGYSVLHAGEHLAPGLPRHSEQAREALIRLCTAFQDTRGVPVTVFFDGSRPSRASRFESAESTIEVLYSTRGKTADDLIERAAVRFLDYGPVLVVTNDGAERRTVIGFGGDVLSADDFLRECQRVLNEQASEIQRINRSESRRYSSPS